MAESPGTVPRSGLAGETAAGTETVSSQGYVENRFVSDLPWKRRLTGREKRPGRRARAEAPLGLVGFP